MAKPTPNKSRLTAFELVSQVIRGGAYANLRLPELLANSKMSLADKAFTTELAYGTLRMQGRHDYLAGKYIDRPITDLDEKIVDLIRIGIHQVSQMRVPDHAAVKETVEVAKFVAGESKASYVNAILRKVVTDGFLIPESRYWPILERLSVEYSHPQWIVQVFFDQLKDWQEVEDLLKSNNIPAEPDLVCWVGKSNLTQITDLGGKAIAGLSQGFKIPGIPSEFLPVVERRAGVQDRGSQLVSEYFLTTAKPNLKWLDLCAGPGGKAAYIYHYLLANFPGSLFLANEINKVRAELVKRVVSNQHVVIKNGADSSAFDEKFDRILIDAPCSGLGALRRRPEARWRKSPQDLKELINLQRKLLISSYELINPGGIIAYVTCSPHLLETKGQVLDFLGSFSKMKLLSLKSLPLKNSSGLQDDGTLQLWTHKDNSDCMFMALFQKEL